MARAALRIAGFLAVAFFWPAGLVGADAAPRAKPSRPAAAKPAPARTAQNDVVSVTEVAARLGLKGHWSQPGRQIVLSDGKRRLELESESRECTIDGLRVYLGEPVVSRHGSLYVDETDYKTRLIPLLRPALIGHALRRPRVIVIDPGHGGNDHGTENARLDLKEKDFTLDVGLRLRKLLARRGYRIVMTREKDERVENPQRSLIAREAHADLFLSIHFNSLFPDTKTTGAEVFTFTRAGQRSDQSRGFGQPDDSEEGAAPVNRFDAWSAVFAHALHRSVLAALKLPDRGQKTKHLGMLRGLECPGALIESGFLSNDVEARKISTSAYRQQIAAALADAVEDYAALLGSLEAKS